MGLIFDDMALAIDQFKEFDDLLIELQKAKTTCEPVSGGYFDHNGIDYTVYDKIHRARSFLRMAKRELEEALENKTT